jgi:xanthine dehydrogenase accessory factor
VSGDLLARIPLLLELHGRLAMATIVSASGSTPRRSTARMLVLPDGSIVGTVGGGKFESLVTEEGLALLHGPGTPLLREFSFAPVGEGSFGGVCGGRATVFLEVVERPHRLLVVGAGHCGRALARAAALCGYEVTVADDREELLDADAFPAGAKLVRTAEDYSDVPLPSTGDAVALVSRSHEVDALAVRRMRGRPAAWLGMIGSRAKRKAFFDALRADGFRDEELAVLRCPIGLDIGAETPEEIAVAVLAELIAFRRGATGRLKG